MERFGKKPDMEAILFLIGIQEFGEIRKKFTKEQKQDLMHVAVCNLLSQSGYYEVERIDQDGWPHFRQLKALPVLNTIEQENFLKTTFSYISKKWNYNDRSIVEIFTGNLSLVINCMQS